MLHQLLPSKNNLLIRIKYLILSFAHFVYIYILISIYHSLVVSFEEAICPRSSKEENCLIEVKGASGSTIATFTYNHEGKRISKTNSIGTVYFHYQKDMN